MALELVVDPAIPRQPTESEGPYDLQRPSREEIAQLTDPYGTGAGTRLIVLDRYVNNRLVHGHPLGWSEEETEEWKKTNPHVGKWGPYRIHGGEHPSLYKTWKRAEAQALGPTRVRPGAIMMFDLRAMPVVTSEAEMAEVMQRPHAERIYETEDEHQFAERMAVEWMQYAAQTRNH